MAGEWVGGVLVRVEVWFWSASSSFVARWFFFQRLVLLSVLELFVSAPFDQCDQVEEELWVAPNLSRRTRRAFGAG